VEDGFAFYIDAVIIWCAEDLLDLLGQMLLFTH
jgi:hypothetical protein